MPMDFIFIDNVVIQLLSAVVYVVIAFICAKINLANNFPYSLFRYKV